MILTAILLALVAASWACLAGWLSWRLGIDYRQALLYAPLKLVRRVSDGEALSLRKSPAPVIYLIQHQSSIDPALALSLLPSQTLHILDQHSATSVWLDPWRDLARTIGFNARHVFVSRRLVRHLKGKGRLAVYPPAGISPESKEFRLYRAIWRIAERSGAVIVPLAFERGAFGALTLKALPPLTIEQLTEQSAASARSQALFNRVEEVRLQAA